MCGRVIQILHRCVVCIVEVLDLRLVDLGRVPRENLATVRGVRAARWVWGPLVADDAARNREKHRERNTEREIQREKHRERNTGRETQRERERKGREKEKKKEKERQRKREKERKTEKDRETERERERDSARRLQKEGHKVSMPQRTSTVVSQW